MIGALFGRFAVYVQRPFEAVLERFVAIGESRLGGVGETGKVLGKRRVRGG